MRHLVIPFFIFIVVCFGSINAGAQVQLLPDLSSTRGGGVMNTCDTSLHLGITTTVLGGYACSFAPEVTPGNNTVSETIWSYFDGAFGQSTSPSLELTFPNQQQYPVCLTVNAYDIVAMQPCSTTVCDLVTPLPDVSCVSLQASFGIASIVGDTITFQDNSTFDGQIQQSIWSFGDGASIASFAPSHVFSGTGPFEVCLTVAGPAPAFCTSTLCQYLYLGPGNVECPALIQQGFVMLQANNLVGVLDTSITSGMNVRIDWDFGDGALAEGNVAVHAYSNSGEFQLCGTLRAWGPLLADTCITTICRPVYPFPLLTTEEVSGSSPWSVFPNPFHDALFLRGPFLGGVPFAVLDATGRLVREGTTSTGVVDLAELDRGLYSLVISQLHGSSVLRIVKE